MKEELKYGAVSIVTQEINRGLLKVLISIQQGAEAGGDGVRGREDTGH